MQRLLTWMAVFALTFAMILNVVLFVQNGQLRQKLAAVARQSQPTQAPAPRPGDLADLRQQLERSEKDRLKATREATSLRDQLRGLESAARERDELKQQVQLLTQEKQQLQNEVGNLHAMNAINAEVVKLRG